MTRFLHTADVHLAADRTERWEALDAVLEAAEEHGAEALLIAGDLLDRGEDHAALRAEVRTRFDRIGIPVVLVPGNHDLDAYAPGQDWGGDVRLLTGEPAAVTRAAGLKVIGVPFPSQPTSFRLVRERVEALVEGKAPHVLVAHGTLIDVRDARVQVESQADEPGPYFPIRTGDLEGLGVRYVALGHYHQPDRWEAGSAPVVYAGSPSPVGPHAWGPRSAAVVELSGDGAEVQHVELPVPYRQKHEVWLTPFEEATQLDDLEQRLREAADGRCALQVTVEGILAGLEEEELRRRAEALCERHRSSFADLEITLRGVGLDPARADLFREFTRRLASRDEAGTDAPAPDVRRRALELAARALKD